MKEYHLKPKQSEEVVPFGAEEEVSPKPVSDGAKEVTAFFAGEGDDDFIEKEALADLVAYAKSMKDTLKDVETRYEKAKDEIKKRLKVDSMEEKKAIHNFGDHQVVVTRKNGQTKVDWEKYVEDELGRKTLDELLSAKESVAKGESTSSYITVGKPSISLEIL